MQYSFEGSTIAEGSRTFMEIPFDMWDLTGCKGNIPVKVSIGDFSFECKLVPKGNGRYFIPVKKAIAEKLSGLQEVSFEVIKGLSRINSSSPYSKDHPIREIDGITEMDIVSGFCGHCCVAMLAGVPLQDVQAVMGKGDGSWSKVMEALDYYGIQYAQKMVHPRNSIPTMPDCCIAYADGGFKLWYKGRYYGSEVPEQSRIVSLLEIVVK